MSSPDLFERRDLGPWDGDDLRAEIEQAHLLRTLTQTDGWHILLEVVEAELAAQERRIMTGRLDPDTYRHQTGYVRGLRAVLDTPAELQRRVAARQTEPAEEE